MEVIVRHKASVRKGKISFRKPIVNQNNIERLEGKDIYVMYEEVYDPKTTDQLGYYFGGIIRATCMETELFGGWEFNDIDREFRTMFLTFTKYKELGNGEKVPIIYVDELRDLSKTRMSKFTENVLNWLAIHEIYPLEPEEYKLGKYKTIIQNAKQ